MISFKKARILILINIKMANHISPDKEKSKPGINFVINFPVRFNISSQASFQKEFDDWCEKNKLTKSLILKKILYDFFEAKDVYGLLKGNPKIRRAAINISEIIKDEMGVDSREFSKMYRDEVTKLMKPVE